jgi:hypothetical protein
MLAMAAATNRRLRARIARASASSSSSGDSPSSAMRRSYHALFAIGSPLANHRTSPNHLLVFRPATRKTPTHDECHPVPISDYNAPNITSHARFLAGVLAMKFSQILAPLARIGIAAVLVTTLGSSACSSDSSGAAGQSASAGAAGSAGTAGVAGAGASGGASGAGGTGGGGVEVFPGIFTDINQPLDMVNDGDDIPLDAAPQGGHVIHVGAQVRGLTGDTVEIRGRLRVSEGGTIVAEEARTVVMRPVPGDPTLMQTDLETISQLSHVPVCPDYDARDVVDTAAVLEVTITELYTDPPRVGVASRKVTPRCNTGDATLDDACTCECKGNYTLGKCPSVLGNKGLTKLF